MLNVVAFIQNNSKREGMNVNGHRLYFLKTNLSVDEKS